MKNQEKKTLEKALITPQEIFANGQVLTFEVAKTLIGKRIAVTSPESRENSPKVREFTVKGFMSEWDKAGQEECTGWNSRKEYWESYMTNVKINELKNTYLIITEYEWISYWSKVAVRCYVDSYYFSEPTFHGSDNDREVYYINIE